MISVEEVKKLAELARIGVGDAEARTLAKDMEGILEYVALVKNVAEKEERHKEKEELVNVMRKDAPPNGGPHESGVYTDALISAAPETERGFVKVKKIL